MSSSELCAQCELYSNRYALMIVSFVFERQELMHVQLFVAQAHLEGFDVPIVGWLAWPRDGELHAAVERQRLDRLRVDLGAVLYRNRFRKVCGPTRVSNAPMTCCRSTKSRPPATYSHNSTDRPR